MKCAHTNCRCCVLKMVLGSHGKWEPERGHHADRTHVESFIGEKGKKGAEERREKDRKGEREEVQT